MRVLIVRLSAIGDVANTMPAVAGIRDALPSARLTWLVEDRARELVECNRDIDEVLEYPRRRWSRWAFEPGRWPRLSTEVRALLADLKNRGFDAAIDFQGNLKGGVLARLSRAPRRIGIARPHVREPSWAFTNEHVTLDGSAVPRFERAIQLARAIAPSLVPRLPSLEPREEDREAVRRSLAHLNVSSERLVAIHPGSSEFGAFKRWPASRYGSLAKMLSKGCGARVLVTWGTGERSLAERVVADSGGAAEFGFVQFVVAADQGNKGLSIGQEDEGFDEFGGGQVQDFFYLLGIEAIWI